MYKFCIAFVGGGFRIYSAPLSNVQESLRLGLYEDLARFDITDIANFEVTEESGEMKASVMLMDHAVELAPEAVEEVAKRAKQKSNA